MKQINWPATCRNISERRGKCDGYFVPRLWHRDKALSFDLWAEITDTKWVTTGIRPLTEVIAEAWCLVNGVEVVYGEEKA